MAPAERPTDKVIDRSLAALRTNKPDAADCKQTLTDPLGVMDAANGRGRMLFIKRNKQARQNNL